MFISISSTLTVYRGVIGRYDSARTKKQLITWVTPDIDYAKEYSDSEVREYRLKVKNAFDLGFRTLETHVPLEEVIGRVLKRLMDDFKKYPRAKAVEIDNRLDSLEAKMEKKHGNKLMEVFKWIQEDPEFVSILRDMGFDMIVSREGRYRTVTSYGVFNKDLLKST